MPQVPSSAGAQGLAGLDEALRRARAAEAAHHDAVLDLRDAKALRLQVLKDELVPLIAGNPDALALFDLAMTPSEPPRLWLDLISGVVMEPDARTYRLTQDSQFGRDILFETADRALMIEHVKQHMAHRIIARERQRGGAAVPRAEARGHSGLIVAFAWLAGFATGALILLIAVALLGNVNLSGVTN